MVAFCLFLQFVLLFVFLFLVDLFLCLSLLSPFLATMPFAGYFLVRCLLSVFPDFYFILFFFLRKGSQFDSARFRVSCDHGWIRSRSVNVR